MDIGIMPLPDEQWARGKCGYKLIQRMACGLPTIASPVGVNARIVKDGNTGFLCTTADEWRNRLSRLMATPDLHATMRNKGSDQVLAHYSLQSQRQSMVEAFRTAASVKYSE